MIIWRDTRPALQRLVPAWLAGADNLQRRESHDASTVYWGIGDAYTVGDGHAFESIDEHWSCAVVSRCFVAPRRQVRWCSAEHVMDTNKRIWSAPKLLNRDGEQLILVSYGRDFLPRLTDEQQRAIDVANAARQAFIAHDGEGVSQEHACRWTAELLALTNHVTPDALAVLGLIDDALIVGVLSAATGLPLRQEGMS